MKCSTTLILFILILTSYVPVNAQNIAINATGAAPDESAMLDVQNANKGLLIPQINLGSLTDATVIPTPAASLLIYNTNDALSEGKGYYYNSGTSLAPVWTKLVASGKEWKLGGNTGTTAETDYIGTKDAKDLVIKTNGSSRVNISSAGISTIGDGTNQTKFESDGSLSLQGSATVFNDIVVPLFNSRLGNDRQPIWASMKSNGSGSRGVYTFTFENQASLEQEVFFTVQLPHNWKEGTAIEPHVHWSPQTATNGNIVWGLEYSWTNYDAATPSAFPNTSIINVTSANLTSADVDKHLITDFGTITPSASQNKISSMLICRFYRKSADAADTYGGLTTGNAAVISFDFHYEIDGIGSSTEYTK